MYRALRMVDDMHGKGVGDTWGLELDLLLLFTLFLKKYPHLRSTSEAGEEEKDYFIILLFQCSTLTIARESCGSYHVCIFCGWLKSTGLIYPFGYAILLTSPVSFCHFKNQIIDHLCLLIFLFFLFSPFLFCFSSAMYSATLPTIRGLLLPTIL